MGSLEDNLGARKMADLENAEVVDLRDMSTYNGTVKSASAAEEAAFGFSTDMLLVEDVNRCKTVAIPVASARITF